MKQTLRLFLVLTLAWSVFPNPLKAEEKTEDTTPPPLPKANFPVPSFHERESPFRLLNDPLRKRSIFMPQLFSYLLPGLDQFLEKQNESGLAYAATGVVGLAYANYRSKQLGADNLKKENKNAYASKDNYYRGYTLGNEIYQIAGGLSTYHSFRSAVRSRQPYGEFAFLTEEETRQDLLLAPFRVDFLLRKTTFIPLAIAAFLSYLQNAPGALAQNDMRSTPLYSSDYFYSAASGYEAGVSEESVFRGWLLPAFYHKMQDETYANVTQAAIFGLAHFATVKVPIVQGLFGYYLGTLTIRNNWTLSESIFVHSWWDLIAFLASYSATGKNPPQKIKQTKILLLPLEWHF